MPPPFPDHLIPCPSATPIPYPLTALTLLSSVLQLHALHPPFSFLIFLPPATPTLPLQFGLNNILFILKSECNCPEVIDYFKDSCSLFSPSKLMSRPSATPLNIPPPFPDQLISCPSTTSIPYPFTALTLYCPALQLPPYHTLSLPSPSIVLPFNYPHTIPSHCPHPLLSCPSTTPIPYPLTAVTLYCPALQLPPYPALSLPSLSIVLPFNYPHTLPSHCPRSLLSCSSATPIPCPLTALTLYCPALQLPPYPALSLPSLSIVLSFSYPHTIPSHCPHSLLSCPSTTPIPCPLTALTLYCPVLQLPLYPALSALTLYCPVLQLPPYHTLSLPSPSIVLPFNYPHTLPSHCPHSLLSCPSTTLIPYPLTALTLYCPALQLPPYPALSLPSLSIVLSFSYPHTIPHTLPSPSIVLPFNYLHTMPSHCPHPLLSCPSITPIPYPLTAVTLYCPSRQLPPYPALSLPSLSIVLSFMQLPSYYPLHFLSI